MSTAKMTLLAWCETELAIERCKMIDPVERDEQQENSGMTEAYYDELDKRATEIADTSIHDPACVADASDYHNFFAQLTLALSADNNDDRLRFLGIIRDCVHARIKSVAREELRKDDLQGGNEDIPNE